MERIYSLLVVKNNCQTFKDFQLGFYSKDVCIFTGNTVFMGIFMMCSDDDMHNMNEPMQTMHPKMQWLHEALIRIYT